MFDFFVEGYHETPKARLLELLLDTPDQQSLQSLTQKDLVEILAERYTMSMVAKGLAVKPPRKTRRGPPAQ